MKQILIALVIFLLTTAATAFADPKIDFNAKCAICHRANKAIVKKAKMLNVDPSKLTLMTSKMSREEMIEITEKGKDKMPAFARELSKEQIADLVDYILLFRRK